MLTNSTEREFTLTGLKRPAVINSKTKQRVILVRDASLSMDDDNKAADASKATRALLAELALAENKEGFYVAVIDYSEHAEIISEFTRAIDLEGNLSEIATKACTNITAGLETAHDLLLATAKPIEGKERFLKPVVILFTDGEHNTGANPQIEASQLKSIADLVTVAFGDDADMDLLRDIANSPEHCYRCLDGRELRAFLAAVGETLTSSIQIGQDATQPLGLIGSDSTSEVG